MILPTQAELDSLRTIDGIASLEKFAKQLCRILTAFAPIIRNKFPDNEELLLALLAAETMCTLLPAALRDVRDVGGDNSSVDGVDPILGENPSADAPVYPEE